MDGEFLLGQRAASSSINDIDARWRCLGICKNWPRGHEAASHYTYLSDTRLQYFLYSPHRSQHKNIIYTTTVTQRILTKEIIKIFIFYIKCLKIVLLWISQVASYGALKHDMFSI